MEMFCHAYFLFRNLQSAEQESEILENEEEEKFLLLNFFSVDSCNTVMTSEFKINKIKLETTQ